MVDVRSVASTRYSCRCGACCATSPDCDAAHKHATTNRHRLTLTTARMDASRKGALFHRGAALYGVETRTLNQAVQRNMSRFPDDFMFQLTEDEAESLRSQVVILNVGRGRHRKFLPYAFTEQGVAMLSSVLRSPRAIAVNIEVMRAFVRMRAVLQTTEGLAQKLDALERKYDGRFVAVFEAIRALMAPTQSGSKRPIGYRRG